jgi:hypothetical protein
MSISPQRFYGTIETRHGGDGPTFRALGAEVYGAEAPVGEGSQGHARPFS